MKIAIDIDDVLVEFQKPFFDYINKLKGTNLLPSDLKSYSYTDNLTIDHEEIIRLLFEFFDTDIFSTLQKTPNSYETVTKLAKENTLIIVTARLPAVEEQTKAWLKNNYGDIFDEIILTDAVNKRHIKKIDFCLERNIDAIIEDSPKEIETFTQAGIQFHLLEKPWNRYVKDTKNLIKHKDWKSIEENFLS